MKATVTFLLLLVGQACAQEAQTFQPPQPHDVQRYEAGWNKNPFTLKTAPPVVESISFAKDLAIGTYYGDSADPTIIIVNTKTNERLRLRQGQPAANGMKLSSVKFGGSRKDMLVEVTLGTETAAVRYNDSYVKQIAAAETTKAPPAQQTRQQPGTPQKTPQTSLPPPFKGAPSGPPPATAQISSGPPGFAPPSGTWNPGNQPPPSGSQPGLASQAAGVNGAPQMPGRSRLTIPVRNAAAISQLPSVPLSP